MFGASQPGTAMGWVTVSRRRGGGGAGVQAADEDSLSPDPKPSDARPASKADDGRPEVTLASVEKDKPHGCPNAAAEM